MGPDVQTKDAMVDNILNFVSLYIIPNKMSKFLIRVARFTEGLLERKLTYVEQNKLKKFVDVNKELVSDKKDVQQVAELAEEFTNSIEGFTSDKKEYLMRDDLDLVSFLGLDTLDKFISEINPKAKRKRAYMCLDSRYARFNQECTRLTWDFTNNLNVVNNSTNVVGPVRDITWIRMHSIVVRKFTSIPQRATILIEELSAQAFILPSGRRFHFVGLLNDLQNPINFGLRNAIVRGQGVPDFTIFDKYELLAGYKFNDGYYRFNKPITTLNEITVSIGNPDTLVVLPKYEFLKVTVLDVTADYIDLDLNEPHYYVSPNSDYVFTVGTWYSVFVDGFTSSDPTVDAYINAKEFTIVSILSDTSIRLNFSDAPAGWHNPFPPTVNVIAPMPGPWTASAVRFNSYRVIMNFELEYIEK
jgi:hypothetical protein